MNKKETILTIAKDLLSIPSVTTSTDMSEKCIDYLIEGVSHIPSCRTKKIIKNGYTSCIIQNFDGLWADIVFNGHVDVVPVQNESQRVLEQTEKQIRCRGAGDMKVGVAMIYELMKEVLDSQTSKKVSLIITSDEEVGGIDGVGYLTDKGYGGDCVLIPDGGGYKNIITSEKGVITIGFTSHGIGVHASRPRLGKNALEHGFSRYTSIKEMIEGNSDYCLQRKNVNWHSTVVLTTLKGGTASNTVPEVATGTINIRFTESYTYEQLVTLIEKVSLQYNSIDWEVTASGSLLHTDNTNSILQKYLKIAKKNLGKDVVLGREHGASDGRYFAKQGSVVILHRPTCENIHALGEIVNTEQIQELYDTYKDFLLG